MCPPRLLPNPLSLDIQIREAEVDKRLRERWVAFDDDAERARVAREVFNDMWGDPRYRALIDRATDLYFS
jgi:hypothetical protein